MQEELISIITPVYNCERLLPKTIESVINQTYQNWEMILVDDCSSDNSAQIINEFSEKDKRVKYIKLEKNSGVAEARNMALRVSKGRFIAYLDADDLWYPEKLEKQANFMLNNNYVFTNTDYEVIDECGCPKGKVVHMRKKTDYHGFLQHNLLQTLGIMVDVKVVSKELCYMNKEYEREDAATWLKILKAGYPCYGLNEVLGQYRRVEGSRSSNKKKAICGMWDLYRKIEKLSLPYSCYCFAKYAIYAVWKRVYIIKK